MTGNDLFTLECEKLQQMIVLGQPFYSHFVLLSNFLGQVLIQRTKHFNPSGLTEELSKHDFMTICFLRKLSLFYEIHCQVRLADAIQKDDCNIEEKIKQYSTLEYAIEPKVRRRIYTIAKECRSILNYEELSETLKRKIFHFVQLCERYSKLIPGFNIFSASIQCKGGLDKLKNTKENFGTLKSNLQELKEFKRYMSLREAKDVEDFLSKINFVQKTLHSLSGLERQKRIDILARIFDYIILSQTFLPYFKPNDFELSSRIYQSIDSFKGILSPDKPVEKKNIFISSFRKDSFEEMSFNRRSKFLYLLKVLSQAENRTGASYILPLLGVTIVSNTIYLIFNSFECTLYDVIDQRLDRNIDNIFTLYENLATSLNFLHDRNISHGAVVPHNIFLSSKHDNTSKPHLFLGYLEVFESCQAFEDNEEEWFTGGKYLELGWKNIVTVAPELYFFKNVDNSKLKYNYSCDIYALSINIYSLLTPYFNPSNYTETEVRRAAMNKDYFPFSRSIHFTRSQLARDEQTDLNQLEGENRRKFSKLVTKRFIDLVCDNNLRPHYPTHFNQEIESISKDLQYLKFSLELCWSKSDFERPTASSVLTSLNSHIRSRTPALIKEDSFQLILTDTVAPLTPDGFSFKQLENILREYFTKVDKNLMTQLRTILLEYGVSFTLSELNKELTISYGVGLNFKKIEEKYARPLSLTSANQESAVNDISEQRQRKNSLTHSQAATIKSKKSRKIPPSPSKAIERQYSSTITDKEEFISPLLTVDNTPNKKKRRESLQTVFNKKSKVKGFKSRRGSFSVFFSLNHQIPTTKEVDTLI